MSSSKQQLSFRMMFRSCLALLGVLTVLGCSSGPSKIGGALDTKVLDTGVLPAPERQDFAATVSPSFLGPSDLIQVDVAGIDWLSGQEIRIDANGEMSFPLAGGLSVAGLSPREVEGLLTERLQTNGRMVNPKVSVNVMESVSRSVTIEGQVKKPGIYPVNSRITLLQAIAIAEGTDEFSKLDDVVVFRTVDSQRYAALYDIGAIRHGVYSDPHIYPNDIVVVGEESGRRMFQDILKIVPLITSPLVIAIDRFTQ